MIPLLGLRANKEPCMRFGPFGDQGSVSSGSPVVASANKWNCDGSSNGSVGDNQVCGRGLLETMLRVVGLEIVLSGNVRDRVGEASNCELEGLTKLV